MSLLNSIIGSLGSHPQYGLVQQPLYDQLSGFNCPLHRFPPDMASLYTQYSSSLQLQEYYRKTQQRQDEIWDLLTTRGRTKLIMIKNYRKAMNMSGPDFSLFD
uniref:Uncharacterized protein n=1 Tax=viral metagenome TaxID=1070528 RepID=A0A6M3JJM9_9ZZZZ